MEEPAAVIGARDLLRPGRWLFLAVTCVCLAISASYEFIEWWSALIGAVTAQLLLRRTHDRQLLRHDVS